MESISHLAPPHFIGLGPAKDYVDDIHDIFRKISLLESLDLHETQLLCNFMVCYSAPRSTVLMREGEPGDFMVFLLTGHAEVLKLDERGAYHRLDTVGPGAVLGEMSMIDHRARSATSVALEPVDMVVLTRHAFKDLLVSLPRLGNKLLFVLLHLVAQRLEHSNRMLIQGRQALDFSNSSVFADL